MSIKLDVIEHLLDLLSNLHETHSDNVIKLRDSNISELINNFADFYNLVQIFHKFQCPVEKSKCPLTSEDDAHPALEIDFEVTTNRYDKFALEKLAENP